MNGFRNWMARMMMGRYGTDELNRFLLIVTAVLIILGIFIHRHIIDLVVVLLLIFIYSRMFSRNIPKRQQENMKYLQMKAKVTGRSADGGNGGSYGGYHGATGGYSSSRPGYGAGSNAAGAGFGRKKKKQKVQPGKRIFICPHCKGSLQVPVGAGRIRIHCPHCGSEFEETV